ncbi:alkaline phosphatase family protein [Halovivax gelatinilyticus]|uniref:alkaline phosphatase family protein n=1 Tax=Halovivax gelatinilyticus TaxID=2961597 RepID=UPI0020CA8B6E|nr:alkaline phosphatase family protein [Halovivax gelatinilyticus]
MTGDTGLETLLVGIDAACERVLDPLFAADELPTLASIFGRGASGPLESQVPPWTASAWPSMYTGMNPGKHGVFSFLSFEGYDWDVVNATDVKERTLWELLSRHGKRSVVVNAPVTHPPREFDGALIPGYTAPENPECHPSGLLDEVRAEIGDYRVYPAGDSADDYRECVEFRGEAFRYLSDRFDPDFGFLQFQVTDTVFHERPGADDVVNAIYREVDRQVADVIDACDPETIVVASDHGMGPYDGYEFRVNSFLREKGLVETVRGGRGMPTWSQAREDGLKDGRDDGTDSSSPGALERSMAALASVGLTSQRIGAALDRVGLAEPVARRVPDSLVSAGTEQVDFPASAAYVRSRIELGVRLNLQGREPNGVVPPSAYDDVRISLMNELRALTTPDGDPVFETVAPREAYFHGPESDCAVDIVTVPAEYDHFLSATLRAEQFGEPTEPWNHKSQGVVAVSGERVDVREGVGAAHLTDVAPTVLATLGIPADERMDGTVLPCVHPIATTAYPRFESDRDESTANDRVERRLADLGYLE